ncbi:MAG: 30S ribosomal protein S4 [Spirochaetota bacterium]|nr:30S ribosomal protein S4 [Spirochaetota bacterium]
MGRYIEPVCRLCRREGVQLFLKGNRCISAKCAVTKRKSPPGVKGKKRMAKTTDYGFELREKQKIKRMYCLRERQFYNTFTKAERKTGKSGDNLLISLESRLDNIVLRSHFSSSRPQARQLITHGHLLVNGKKVNIPSYQVRQGDVIEARPKSKNLSAIRDSLKNISRQGAPTWLEIDENEVKSKILLIPSREDIQIPANEQLVVEFYSK